MSILTGIVGVILLFLSVYLSEPKYKRIVRISGFIVLLFSPAYAWRDEHRALINLQQKFKSDNPFLVGTIEQVVTGDSPDIESSQLFIVITIKNLGTPSIVDGWTIVVESELGRLSQSPTIIPEGLKLRDAEGKIVARFSKNEAIYEKTTYPIPKGGQVRGWLRFIFKGTPAEVLRKPGTKISIRFHDVVDRSYTVSHVMTGKPSELKYFPGTEQPFIKR